MILVIWYDITNTPQVHFLTSIIKALNKVFPHEYIISTRDFSETETLLKQLSFQSVKTFGTHYGKDRFKKIHGLMKRFSEVLDNKLSYDVSISCGSEAAIWSSWLRGKQSIAFGDNDLAKQWTYGLFVSHAFFPNSIPQKILTSQGISPQRLTLYNGFKEDIYIADYVPNQDFLNTIPFQNYVIVRPENLQANYVKGNQHSITPALLKNLSNKGYNIIYLPRYPLDRSYAQSINNIFIPEKPLNGLDACYYADAVFTGAGTFAREAACLGTPAFSFFAGAQLLAVDKTLIEQKKVFFSRDVNEILEKVKHMNKRNFDASKSKSVRDEVISKLISVLKDEHK
jgi:hypothetical protein